LDALGDGKKKNFFKKFFSEKIRTFSFPPLLMGDVTEGTVNFGN